MPSVCHLFAKRRALPHTRRVSCITCTCLLLAKLAATRGLNSFSRLVHVSQRVSLLTSQRTISVSLSEIWAMRPTTMSCKPQDRRMALCACGCWFQDCHATWAAILRFHPHPALLPYHSTLPSTLLPFLPSSLPPFSPYLTSPHPAPPTSVSLFCTGPMPLHAILRFKRRGCVRVGNAQYDTSFGLGLEFVHRCRPLTCDAHVHDTHSRQWVASLSFA